jgi:citrate synthase
MRVSAVPPRRSTLIASMLTTSMPILQTSSVSTSVGAVEAARILGVTRSTLYAYVSRGTVTRRTAVDGRTSLFDRDELEALSQRSRSRARTAAPRPSIDVQIVTSITRLDDHAVQYRGHPTSDLARRHDFETTAELLWTGRLPETPPAWPELDADLAGAVRRVLAAAPTGLDPLARLTMATMAASARHRSDDPPTAARRLIMLAPVVIADPTIAASEPPPDASTARRLAVVWHEAPTDRLVDALQRALVLLADHELATSTLAVRVAGSVRADPYSAFAAGLAVLRSPLHGSAAEAVHALLARCETTGVAPCVRAQLDATRRLPGFGHSIYRGDDPRVDPLLEAVRSLDDPAGRLHVVDRLLEEAGRSVTVRPNIDLALGALSFVGGLAPDVALFAVARLAGWAAHLDEELTERPLRFRGIARTAPADR